jgi:hypothetical protein
MTESIVCAGTEPTQATSPPFKPFQESRPQTPSRPVSVPGSLRPHDIYGSHHPSRSSYDIRNTYGNQAVAHDDSLQPYSFSVHSASHSSLGTVSQNSYALNNISRTSGLSRISTIPRARAPSSVHSSHSRLRHLGGVGFSQGPTPCASSTNVADPSGNVAVPVANHPGLPSKERTVFPMAPEWIERYDRNIKMYVDNVYLGVLWLSFL